MIDHYMHEQIAKHMLFRVSPMFRARVFHDNKGLLKPPRGHNISCWIQSHSILMEYTHFCISCMFGKAFCNYKMCVIRNAWFNNLDIFDSYEVIDNFNGVPWLMELN